MLASRSHLNVLITGETGTGKELTAWAIHNLSNRSRKRLVPYNCARTPRELFDSEFFGHLRGAFTGANSDHVGLLEQAHESHLFLDELEAMSLENQPKLLRAIEDGEVRPVGASESRRVSVRYISATNRDAQQLLADGHLREDLFFRLKGLQITVPPLRDRAEDIPLLARHFLDGADSCLTEAAMNTLQAYHWPGNVRELKYVLLVAKERAQAAGDLRIDREHLDIPEEEISTTAGVRRDSSQSDSLKAILHRELEKALKNAEGNKTLAAARLGIGRTTLRRMLKVFGSGKHPLEQSDPPTGSN